jgi:peptide/nickel transport system substrate-binding protein
MKELKIAQSEVKILPLWQTTDEPDKLTIQSLVFETLIKCKDGELYPGLAENWHIEDEGKRWVLKLKEKFFHDGTNCTSEDVINSLVRMRDAKDSFGMSGAYARYLKDLDFLPVSKTHLDIISPKPNADLGDILCEINISKESQTGSPIIGTGPYRIVEYTNDHSVLLERFSDNPGDSFCEIYFTQIDEAEERYNALVNGEVHLATRLENMMDKPGNNSLIWTQSPTTLSVIYYLNGFEEPFCHPAARRAVNIAINIQRIIDAVWDGKAIPAATIVSPFHFGFPPGLLPHHYDPEGAKSILENYSLPDPLILRTPLHMPDRSLQVSHMVKEDLEKIGLNIDIDVQEDRPQYAREVGAKQTGHFAIFDSSPHSTYRVLNEKISSKVRGTWWQGVEDSPLAAQIESVSSILTRKARETGYRQILSYLHGTPPWLFLYHPITQCAYLPGIKGVGLSHSGLVHFHNGQQ